MPATILELFDGRSETIAGKLSATIPYAIIGAVDEDEARTTALAIIPITYNSIPRSNLGSFERVNATTWKVTASYEMADGSGSNSGGDPATLENSYTFEASGGSQNVKQGITGYARRFAVGLPGGEIVDSCIGDDGQTVSGVDIVIPQFQWSETYWFAPATMTTDRKNVIASCVGEINDRVFRGYAAGEVLFLGASGSRQGNGWWQITFKFAYQKNATNIKVGPITVSAKLGWQHLWVSYGIVTDGVSESKKLANKAKSVYIENVYSSTDLAYYLGI